MRLGRIEDNIADIMTALQSILSALVTLSKQQLNQAEELRDLRQAR